MVITDASRSFNKRRMICLLLHGLLIAVHIVLLVAHFLQLENLVVVDIGRPTNMLTLEVILIPQAIITVSPTSRSLRYTNVSAESDDDCSARATSTAPGVGARAALPPASSVNTRSVCFVAGTWTRCSHLGAPEIENKTWGIQSSAHSPVFLRILCYEHHNAHTLPGRAHGDVSIDLSAAAIPQSA